MEAASAEENSKQIPESLMALAVKITVNGGGRVYLPEPLPRAASAPEPSVRPVRLSRLTTAANAQLRTARLLVEEVLDTSPNDAEAKEVLNDMWQKCHQDLKHKCTVAVELLNATHASPFHIERAVTISEGSSSLAFHLLSQDESDASSLKQFLRSSSAMDRVEISDLHVPPPQLLLHAHPDIYWKFVYMPLHWREKLSDDEVERWNQYRCNPLGSLPTSEPWVYYEAGLACHGQEVSKEILNSEEGWTFQDNGDGSGLAWDPSNIWMLPLLMLSEPGTLMSRFEGEPVAEDCELRREHAEMAARSVLGMKVKQPRVSKFKALSMVTWGGQSEKLIDMSQNVLNAAKLQWAPVPKPVPKPQPKIPESWDPLLLTEPLPKMIQKRLLGETRQLQHEAANLKEIGIRAMWDEDLINRVHVLMRGPDGTPYEGGLFYFIAAVSRDYPQKPPRMRLMSTDDGRVRFNPNLYANGYVCVSTLNTWGESWNAETTIRTALISVLSLFTANPCYNEPGITQERVPANCSNAYNEIIRHEVIRVAVCDLLACDSFQAVACVAHDMAGESENLQRLRRMEAYCLEHLDDDGMPFQHAFDKRSADASLIHFLLRELKHGHFQWHRLLADVRRLIEHLHSGTVVPVKRVTSSSSSMSRSSRSRIQQKHEVEQQDHNQQKHEVPSEASCYSVSSVWIFGTAAMAVLLAFSVVAYQRRK